MVKFMEVELISSSNKLIERDIDLISFSINGEKAIFFSPTKGEYTTSPVVHIEEIEEENKINIITENSGYVFKIIENVTDIM